MTRYRTIILPLFLLACSGGQDPGVTPGEDGGGADTWSEVEAWAETEAWAGVCQGGLWSLDGALCRLCRADSDGYEPGGEPLDDGNPCTDDACDPGLGATHWPNGAECDDGDPDTVYDWCQGDRCQGTPLICEPAAWELVQGRCRPCQGDGTAWAGEGEPLDDGQVCTEDRCEVWEGPSHLPIDAPCDDGDPATPFDRCVDGACVGSQQLCEPWTWQLEGGACRRCDGEGLGWAEDAGAPNDGNPCTDDLCDAGLGVTHVPNQAPCDDGDPETPVDHCAGGICVGAEQLCEPGVWQDVGWWCQLCDESGMAWANDGMALDDGDPCTEDLCDPASGTRHEPGNEGGWCGEDGACETMLRCHDGVCEGAPVLCDDGSPCTEELCDPALGCLYEIVAGDCDDGNALTPDDVCVQGICVGWIDPDGDGAPNYGEGPPCDGPDLLEGCLDNCPARANAPQLDSDDDGTGDACASGAEVRWWSRVVTDTPVIALTFDDGWSDAALTGILDVLELKNARATFLLNGMYFVDGTLSLVNGLRLVHFGHEIGNHTANHTLGDSFDAAVEAISENESIYLDLGLGSMIPYFRAPGGAWTPEIQLPQALEVTGFTEHVFWSLDAMDWTDPQPDPAAMAACVVEAAQPGDVALFHVGNLATAEALPAILDGLAARGFSFVTLEQLVAFGDKEFLAPFDPAVKSCGD